MNLKTIAILARRELKGMFDHPTGYILLVVFIAVSDFLFFRQAYMLRAATLRPMFDLLPWMFLFFVPAVTMRAIAEETRQGTLEVLLAQPITELELLLGKYLGQVLFIWIALALTLPIPLGLALGADLQAGIIVAQYVGGALLGAGLAGVGLWASSLSPNQITAFIVAAGVTFVLILVGLDPLLVGLPPLLGTIAAQLGVLSHFANIARGVIDLRDAVYFGTLAAIFLSLAYLVLMRRKLARKGETWGRLRLGVSLIVATLVVVNLFGQHIGGRLDLTPGKAYTLSRATRQLLGNLPDLLTVKLFVSKELPPEIALLQRDLRDMLSDYRAAGRGKVRLVTLDPSSDSTALQEARNLGIPSVQFNVMGQSELRVKEGYLGIAIQYAGQNKTIPFVQRTEDLEYRLSSLIRSLTVTDRPKLGLATFGTNPMTGRTFDALREQLEERYDVRTLSFSTDSEPPQELSLVVIAGMPFSLNDAQVEHFKRYLAEGGNALIMASGMDIPERSFFATPREVTWNKVLEPYGVSIRSDMVYDLASNERVAVPVQFGRLLLAYPFWVRALSTQASVINEEIDGVFLPWTSSLDTSKARPGTVTPLLVSSRASGVKTAEVFLEPRQQFETDSLAPRLLAAMVNPLAADGGENSADSGKQLRGRVVVIGNSDIVADRNVQNAPENLTFVLNAVDWLAEDESLIAIRAKSRTPPPLVFESAFLRESVKYGNVAGVPVLLVVAGAAQWLRRRRLQSQPYRPLRVAGEGSER
jgi:ABC-2 type transport system permease protein